MKHPVAASVVVLIFAAATAAVVVTAIFAGADIAGVLLFVLLTVFILQGLAETPTRPLNTGVPTIFGDKIEKLLSPGLHFFPLRGLWYGLINIPVTPREKTMPVKTVRVHDQGEADLEVTFVWQPAHETAKHILAFINTGEDDEVNKRIQAAIEERSRRWAGSDLEGPADTKTIQGSARDVTAALVKQIAGNGIPSVNEEIPTLVLLRYFAQGEAGLKNQEKTKWLPIWNGYSQERQREIRTKVDERSCIVDALSKGNAKILLDWLGVNLLQLNVKDAHPSGKTAESIERERKETADTAAETIEIQNVCDRLNQLMASKDQGGAGLTREQAVKVLLLERGKGTTQQIEHKEYSVDPSLAELAKFVIGVWRQPQQQPQP